MEPEILTKAMLYYRTEEEQVS